MNPELKMSFAKMVPKGLWIVSIVVRERTSNQPGYVRVSLDHFFGSGLEEDFSAVGASCFEVDRSSYTRIKVRRNNTSAEINMYVEATGCCVEKR